MLKNHVHVGTLIAILAATAGVGCSTGATGRRPSSWITQSNVVVGANRELDGLAYGAGNVNGFSAFAVSMLNGYNDNNIRFCIPKGTILEEGAPYQTASACGLDSGAIGTVLRSNGLIYFSYVVRANWAKVYQMQDFWSSQGFPDGFALKWLAAYDFQRSEGSGWKLVTTPKRGGSNGGGGLEGKNQFGDLPESLPAVPIEALPPRE